MKIELTQSEVIELSKAIESHIKRLSGFIFSTPNEKAQKEFENRKDLMKSVLSKLGN